MFASTKDTLRAPTSLIPVVDGVKVRVGVVVHARVIVGVRVCTRVVVVEVVCAHDVVGVVVSALAGVVAGVVDLEAARRRAI